MIKISVRTHRGKPCLYWRRNGKPAYRQVKIMQNVEAEIDALRDELRQDKFDPYAKHNRKPILSGDGKGHLDDFIRALQTGVAGRGKAGETYLAHVRQMITRVFVAAKITRLRDIKHTLVKETIAGFKRLPQSKKKKEEDEIELSDRSKNYHLRVCKQFSKWLFEDERTETDQLARAKRWQKERKRHRRGRFQTEEVCKLITTAKRSKVAVDGYGGLLRARLYLFAAGTGLRRGELAVLDRSSFLLVGDDVQVFVAAEYTKNGDDALITLCPALVEQVKSWVLTLPDGQKLFPGLAGKKTNRMIRHDLKAAKLPYQTTKGEFRDFHAVRHTYVSMLWEVQDAKPVDVKQDARHASLVTTNGYSHPSQVSTAKKLALPSLSGA